MRPAALLTLALAALLLDTASAKKGKRKTKSKSKGNPPEGRPGGPGGHRPITQGPYIDPKTRPDPDLDPTAFLVDFLVAGTVDGERGQDIGTFTLKVSPNWAPIGVERMRKLLEVKFFDDTKFFQILKGFQGVSLAQGGVSGDPATQENWKFNLIKDDPRLVNNKRGTFSFAASIPNSRTPQFVINLSDNGRMMNGNGPYGMCPIGEIVEGIEIMDALQGTDPVSSDDIDNIMTYGNVWADEFNPDFAYIKTATIREGGCGEWCEKGTHGGDDVPWENPQGAKDPNAIEVDLHGADEEGDEHLKQEI